MISLFPSTSFLCISFYSLVTIIFFFSPLLYFVLSISFSICLLLFLAPTCFSHRLFFLVTLPPVIRFSLVSIGYYLASLLHSTISCYPLFCISYNSTLYLYTSSPLHLLCLLLFCYYFPYLLPTAPLSSFTQICHTLCLPLRTPSRRSRIQLAFSPLMKIVLNRRNCILNEWNALQKLTR